MKSRISLLIACLLIWGFASAQDVSKPVTYEGRAASLRSVLADLSKASGVTLEPTNLTAEDIVLVSVRDVPLSEVMKRLAGVIAGQWREDGGVYRLHRDEAAARIQAQAELKRRTDEIAKAIALSVQGRDLNKMLDERAAAAIIREAEQLERGSANVSNEEAERRMARHAALQEASPAEAALYRVLGSINPAELALLPVNGRLVWATNPTKMQRNLGPQAYRALQQYATEHQVWAAALARSPQMQPESDHSIPMGGTYRPLKSPPAKFLVFASRFGMGSGINIELTVVDADGRYITQASTNLAEGATHWDGHTTPSAPAPAEEKVIELSAESRMLAEVMRGQAFPGARQAYDRLPPELREKLVNPERHDPLSFVPTDLLLGIAKHKNQNVIASLPDLLFSWAVYGTDALRPSGALAQFESFNLLRIKTEEGWLIAEPTYPSEARRLRTNRAALGKLLRSLAKSGQIGLDELAQFALKSPETTHESLATTLMYAFFSDSLAGLDYVNWELLRLYGSLSTEQRRALEAKQQFRIGALSPQQRDILAQLVFFHVGGFVGVAVSSSSEGLWYGDIMHEPTHVLGNGLPAEGVFSMTIQGDQVLIPVGAGPYTAPMGPDEVGGQLAIKERPDLFKFAEDMPEFTSFRMAGRKQMHFHLLLTPNLQPQYTLTDISRSGTQTYTLETLPPEIKERIERAREETRKAYKDMKPSDFHYGGRPDRGIPPL